MADGHVSKRDKLMFTVLNQDRDVIEKIKSSLKSGHPIRSARGKYVSYTVSSKSLCDRLREFGLHNRKTYGFDFERMLSHVPSDLERHFIRGMFDGDGCIGHYHYSYTSKTTYHFGYTGTRQICDYLRKVLCVSTKDVDEGNGFYTVRSSCRADIARIGHFLYDDATIYMDRKKKIFDEVFALIECEK